MVRDIVENYLKERNL